MLCSGDKKHNQEGGVSNVGNYSSDGTRSLMAAAWVHQLPQTGYQSGNSLSRRTEAKRECPQLRGSQLQRICDSTGIGNGNPSPYPAAGRIIIGQTRNKEAPNSPGAFKIVFQLFLWSYKVQIFNDKLCRFRVDPTRGFSIQLSNKPIDIRVDGSFERFNRRLFRLWLEI